MKWWAQRWLPTSNCPLSPFPQTGRCYSRRPPLFFRSPHCLVNLAHEVPIGCDPSICPRTEQTNRTTLSRFWVTSTLDCLPWDEGFPSPLPTLYSQPEVLGLCER